MKIGNWEFRVINEWKYLFPLPLEIDMLSIHIESDYIWVTIFNISFLMERDW